MKFKHFAAGCLCFVMAGCSTAAGVTKGNVFYSEGNPNIRIQIDAKLISQEPFSYQVLTGGSAGTSKNTIYPFVEIVGDNWIRALLIGFRDMTKPTDRWIESAGLPTKSFAGVDFRVAWTGNFLERSITLEVTKRNYRMTGQYSAVQFVKAVHQTRLIVLAYIEKTPSELLNMQWDLEKLSKKQKEYFEQLELRATEVFTVTSHSTF